jgi:hypothetical protein
VNERKRHPWPHEDVAEDFDMAVCGGSGYGRRPDTRMVGVGAGPVEPVTAYEVDEVIRWHVTYHGEKKWEPGMATGTELSLYAVLRLRSGLWASVVAGNDYTGWGCQDFADVRIGESEEAVVQQGLDSGGRALLGYGAEAAPERGGLL